MGHSLFLHVSMIGARHDGVIVFITSDRSRFTLDTLVSRHESAALWDGYIICMLPVPYAYYTMIQWPVISLWSLIISHLHWLDLDGDNGSIERASQRWCVFLCTCLKWITHSNGRIATYGVALCSWLGRMYVRYITDQSCLHMCIEFLMYEQYGG